MSTIRVECAVCATTADLATGAPEQPTGKTRFAPDDLLTLHEQLGTDAWFSALTAGCGRP